MKSILIKLFVSIVFFAGGLAAYLYITKPMADEARASETWPSVEGEIIRSEINSFHNSEGKEMYSPDVAYVYQLDGKDYSGSRISDLSYSTSSEGEVRRKLAKYPQGSTVKVYYDTEDPYNSTLKPGIGFVANLLYHLPLAFCAVSVLLILGLVRRFIKGE